MKPEDTYQLIDRYLNNELFGEELDVFRIRMKNDPDFAYDVYVQRLIQTQMVEARKKELKSLLKEKAEVKYYGNSWGQRWMYASAAIMVLFVSAFFVIEYYVKPTSDPKEIKPGLVKPAPSIQEPKTTGNPPSDSIQNTFDSAVFEEPLLVMEDNEEPIEEPLIMEVEDESGDELDVLFDAPKAESVELAEEVVVKKDELIAQATFNVRVLTLVEQAVSTSEENKSLFGRKKAGKEKADSASGAETTAEIKTTGTEVLKVEYWKSPVNYIGYKYNETNLILYGVGEKEQLSFKKLASNLYMLRNEKWYMLSRNDSGMRFKALTDPTLLEQLQQ